MENGVIKKDDLVKAELFTASDEYVNMFVEWAIDNLKTALNKGLQTAILSVTTDFMHYVTRKKQNYSLIYLRGYNEDIIKEIIDKGGEILKQNGYSSCSYLITSDSSIVSYELKEWTKGWTMILSVDSKVILNLRKRIKRKILWHNITKWGFVGFISLLFFFMLIIAISTAS